MKWPRAITLVIVLKRSLKEGNGSTKTWPSKLGGRGAPSFQMKKWNLYSIHDLLILLASPPLSYFQNPLPHIFRPSYGPDVLTTDRRNTKSCYDPPRSEQSEPNSITHTIVWNQAEFEFSLLSLVKNTKELLLRKDQYWERS